MEAVEVVEVTQVYHQVWAGYEELAWSSLRISGIYLSPDQWLMGWLSSSCGLDGAADTYTPDTASDVVAFPPIVF